MKKKTQEELSTSWLSSELSSRGAVKPSVHLDGKGVWLCRDGRTLLGRLSRESVDERNADAVQGLFRMRGAVTLSFYPREMGDDAWKAWAIVDAVTHGQRAAVLAVMRAEHEHGGDGGGNVAPTTHGYRVLCAAVDEWASARKWKDGQGKAWAGVAGDVMAFASKFATERAMDWLKRNAHDKSPPWFRSRSITVPEKSYVLEREGRDVYLVMRLQGMDRATRRIQPFRVKAFARGGAQWADVRRVLDGEYESGAGRLIWDDDSRKWLFRISYQKPRPTAKSNNGILLARPSLKSVVALFDDEARGVRPRRGVAELPVLNIIAAKMRLDAMLAERGQHQPFICAGARGHGKKRRYRDMAAIREKETNLVKTFCEQQAAYIARQGAERGKMVVIDESAAMHRWHPDDRMRKWLQRFPFCMLRDKIQYACDKAGVAHARVTSDRKCPECGADLDIGTKTRMRLDGKPIDRLVAVCKACSMDGPLESVLAWRGLQMAARTDDERSAINGAWRAYLKQTRAIEEGTMQHDECTPNT